MDVEHRVGRTGRCTDSVVQGRRQDQRIVHADEAHDRHRQPWCIPRRSVAARGSWATADPVVTVESDLRWGSPDVCHIRTAAARFEIRGAIQRWSCDGMDDCSQSSIKGRARRGADGTWHAARAPICHRRRRVRKPLRGVRAGRWPIDCAIRPPHLHGARRSADANVGSAPRAGHP